MLMIKIETTITKSFLCNMIFGVFIVIIFFIIHLLKIYGDYNFLITAFVVMVFIVPLLDDLINIVIQRRKFYIIDGNSITIGVKSFLSTTEDTFNLNKNLTVKIRFENLLCYESIELYAFGEKILIEKSELSNKDYEQIKKYLTAYKEEI
jgi:hypothetical protein